MNKFEISNIEIFLSPIYAKIQNYLSFGQGFDTPPPRKLTWLRPTGSKRLLGCTIENYKKSPTTLLKPAKQQILS